MTHVHINDHVGTQSVPPGQGQTDNRAVSQVLRKGSYHGWLTVELEVANRHNALQYVKDAFTYMRELLPNGR